MAIKVHAAVASKIGFASHQNAVPLLSDLELVGDENTHENLKLVLSADPPFLEPRTWIVDRMVPESTIHVSDRDVSLAAGFLADLTEAVSGTVTLTLQSGEDVLASSRYPVELLGRSEWGGSASMAELLAAFVMPNDPAVDRVLKTASDVLRRAGKPDGLDGYTSTSRSRVWELASAIWSAVVSFRISYALPPASFETQGQKVRFPSAVLENRLATCLDTALLFAAALEQAGLNPLVVVTKGHAFVGVWLQPQEFSSLVTDEAASLRKRFDLKELVVFETTLATAAIPPSFAAAVESGRRQIAEDADDGFVMAIDIRRGRMRRIRPLGRPGENMPGSATAAAPDAAEALEEAPALPGFDVEVETESATPAGRIALWQRKLLDLTTRNRLLHLPDGAKAVRLLCPDPGGLEDRLADGKRIRVVAMPDFGEGGRDAALHAQRTGERLEEEYGRAALARNEVLSPLDAKKLDATLVDLYRKARTDLEEGGANTLFLALGFLRWKKTGEESRTYRAPLILLPVRLDRKSALSGVTMVRHDDEPRFNLTLLELLRHDFDLDIPGLAEGLPQDGSGIDVAGVWTTVRRAIREVPGFEVVEDVALATLSFAKYLMWKDLADRTEQLKESPVVRHLIERAEETFPPGPPFPRSERLDDEVDPAEVFVPLPADSSQLAAVIASARGCDFVLDGPPGTGKSQTIANMIAHNLALGRRVLFVAEKRAALDVVHRRLAEKGLGEFCLELHSSKTSKAEVLKSLERAWDTRDTLSAEQWAREASDAKRLRDRLNDVVRLLHREHPNGLTVHRAIGRVIRDWTPDLPELGWPRGTDATAMPLASLRELARRLDLNRDAVTGLPPAFAAVTQRDWSNGWQERVVAAAREVGPALGSLLAARDTLLAATRLTLPADTSEDLLRLRTLARALLATSGLDLRFAFAPDAARSVTLARKLADDVDAFVASESSLSVAFSRDAIARLDLDGFEAAWARAVGRLWFISFFARRSVAKRLAAAGGASARPDPAKDLPILKRLAGIRAEIDASAPALGAVSPARGIESDPGTLRTLGAAAEAVRSAIVEAAPTPDLLIAIRGAAAALVVDANEFLATDGRVALTLAELDRRRRDWADLLDRFDALLGTEAAATGRPFGDVANIAEAVLANQPRLKAWCDWQRVRKEAMANGLGAVVQAIEAGAVPKSGSPELFETIYCRWFAADAIDAEPRLRDLVTAEHAEAIETFRRVDDRLSSLSVRYIRARLCGLIPDKSEGSKRDGYGILKHELRKQRAHKPIRQLAVEMGEAFTRLAPCMLMSPLSIAQYLPANQAPFDLVIFDEASQITPWDAVGSIARGRQVVVAGDPRQMPPTNFFNRSHGAGIDDDVEPDLDSILNECLAAGVPSHGLSWHYRSRHESLITFSNHRYYDGSLITFPAAVTRDSAVEWRQVQGVYAKGTGRTNQVEAEAIVAEVVRRLTDPELVADRHSLAIITLNSEQQTLVENLLDVERKKRPEIERHFGEDVLEPVVVKNLETVQGDERDIILLGIGYGPTEPGATTMSMNFGPLNRDGGWRRLNVAVTRARREMIVFTSFDPGMIDLNRTSARAVKDLKHFVEFAERGPRAIVEAVQGSQGGFESPFEEAVAAALAARGWTVVPQIGVSRFRIDLGVVHPDRPGDYLAGVECDGAAYHSAATARDRDKVRAAILGGLGWKLVRIWSTDWWIDKASSLQRVDAQLQALLEADRAAAERLRSEKQAVAMSGAPTPEPQPNPLPRNDDPAPSITLGTVVTTKAGSYEQTVGDSEVSAGSMAEALSPAYGEAEAGATESANGSSVEPVLAAPTDPSRPIYRRAEFGSLRALVDPNAFHEARYDETLHKLIAHVVEEEAPVSLDALVVRVARVHDFLRAGPAIRERIVTLARKHHHVAEHPPEWVFVWGSEAEMAGWRGFRVAAEGDAARALDEIAPQEIWAAAEGADGPDPVATVARRLGTKRLSQTGRRRVEDAMAAGGR